MSNQERPMPAGLSCIFFIIVIALTIALTIAYKDGYQKSDVSPYGMGENGEG